MCAPTACSNGPSSRSAAIAVCLSVVPIYLAACSHGGSTPPAALTATIPLTSPGALAAGANAMWTVSISGGSAPYATGMSPTALKPDNAAINAGLEGEAGMRRRFPPRFSITPEGARSFECTPS